jgi:Terminase large subunit, T4likevirus-type, N-terminal
VDSSDNVKQRNKLNYNKSRSTRANIRQKAMEELWNRGAHLDRMFHSGQLECKRIFETNSKDGDMFMLLLPRRFGKSVFCFGTADNYCRQNRGARVLYLSKTSDNLKEILDQASGAILQTCPEHMKPTHLKKDQKFVYKNGSEIRFKGMDKAGADSLRGVTADLIILDEFCFMDDVSNLIDNVLMPMLIERGGRMLLASTPPIAPGHESIEYITKCQLKGNFVKKTIYDCPRWTPEQITQFEEEAGGSDSDTFRREYLCQIITDRNRAILTSATADHMDKIVRKWKKPTDYTPDHYISIDPGGRDQTAILFAYYDYLEATLVIDDEVILDSASTEEIQKAVDKKLKGEWKGITPHRIIMDNNNLILVKDMQKLHGMRVKATKKDKKEAQVNNTNLLMMREEIIIDPRCVNLDKQCRYGVWNKTRTSYERTAALSHCDAIDALVYLVRNINKGRNPIPDYIPDRNTTINHDPYDSGSSSKNIFKQIFKRR